MYCFGFNEKWGKVISKPCDVNSWKEREGGEDMKRGEDMKSHYSRLQHDCVISKANKDVVRFKYLHLLLRSTTGYNQKYNWTTLVRAA